MIELFVGHMKVNPRDWSSIGGDEYRVLRIPSKNNLPISVFRVERTMVVMHYGYIPAGSTTIRLSQLHAVQIGN